MTRKTYKNRHQKQTRPSHFDRADTAQQQRAVRHVQRLGVRSASLAFAIAELAGLNTGADHA